MAREGMQWAAAVSEQADTAAAADEACAAIEAQLAGRSLDLLFLFSSSHHRARDEVLLQRIRKRLAPRLLLGCSARSVIGAGREIEERPGLSLTAASLGAARLAPIRIAGDGFPRGQAVWREAFGLAAAPTPHFVLLGDPFSCDAQDLVAGLDGDFPGSTKLGGLASGADRPGDNALYLDDRVHRDGLVGVALQGEVAVDAIVAQGCRPVGQPMFVTRAREHLLVELDGRAPIAALRALFESGSPRDRALMQTSLFLGIEMLPDQSRYERGDFLIRNLIGVDSSSGAIAVGTHLREGQVVQFHLRDAATSAEDLERRLSDYAGSDGEGGGRGALLFSCLGRGALLYGHPDHDSEAFRRHVGALPLGGFFCNGEIGPVQGRTFLHGYTSAFGIFRSAARS